MTRTHLGFTRFANTINFRPLTPCGTVHYHPRAEALIGIALFGRSPTHTGAICACITSCSASRYIRCFSPGLRPSSHNVNASRERRLEAEPRLLLQNRRHRTLSAHVGIWASCDHWIAQRLASPIQNRRVHGSLIVIVGPLRRWRISGMYDGSGGSARCAAATTTAPHSPHDGILNVQRTSGPVEPLPPINARPSCIISPRHCERPALSLPRPSPARHPDRAARPGPRS